MNCVILALLVALSLSNINALNDDSNVADGHGIEERLTDNADGPPQEVQEPAESGHEGFFQQMKEAVDKHFGLEPPSERKGSRKKKQTPQQQPQKAPKAKGKTAGKGGNTPEENHLALVKYVDHNRIPGLKSHPGSQEETAGQKKGAHKGRGKNAEEEEEEETKPGKGKKAGGKVSLKKGKTVGEQQPARTPAPASFKYVEDYDKDKVDKICIAPCKKKGEEMEHVFKTRVYLAKRKECRCYYEHGIGYVSVKV